MGYTAQLRIKQGGVVVHSESQTFSRKALAAEWLKRREVEIAAARASGAVILKRTTIADLIDAYTKAADGIHDWGRSKKADLARLAAAPLSKKDATRLQAADIVTHAMERRDGGTGPATVLNDLVWLRQVFLHAHATLGLDRPLQAVDQARAQLLRQRVVAKPVQRVRRLLPEEERLLLDYFGSRDARAKLPMQDVMLFALATARRQEEIFRLRWVDVDFEKGIAWLDDVKHPRHKTGNRRSFRLLSDAAAIIQRQPREAGEAMVFPYNHRSCSAAFTRACKLLGIEDLHFHDLRHEATSRLFERGYSIQEVAQFTLHDSWATLKRYTHLRPEHVPERAAPAVTAAAASPAPPAP